MLGLSCAKPNESVKNFSIRLQQIIRLKLRILFLCVWGMSGGCLDMFGGCLDVSRGCLDMSGGCLDVFVGCLDMTGGVISSNLTNFHQT